MSTAAGPRPHPRRPRPAPHRVEAAPPTPEGHLRELVGVTPDASISAFRAAYDLAMHRATRSGDHRHALTLSRAYDRLPLLTRQRMYPSSRATVGGTATRGRQPGGRVRSGGARPRRAGTARRRRSRRARIRLFVFALAAALAVAVGTYVGAQQPQQGSTSSDRTPQRSVQVAVPAGGEVTVPMSAPVGGNGLVSLMCRLEAGEAGYLFAAPRGASVSCTNGATPVVVP